MTVAPNFAFDLVARVAYSHTLEPFPMRKCIIGGDRVEADTLTRVHRVFGDRCFSRSAFIPAYGLAEAVLAVTMTPVGAPPDVVHLDPLALRNGDVVSAGAGSARASVVSVGAPLSGNEIRIRGQNAIGEVCVRSPSLAMGYLGRPLLTRRTFKGGELRTGDLGFIANNELFITGRLDDMLCVGGRNVFARDIEREAGKVTGIRPGCCAIVRVEHDGGARLVLVAELADNSPAPEKLACRVNSVARRAAGVHLSECLFLPRGLLPKTPSGKVQRFRCRELAARPPKGARSVTLEPVR